MKSNKTIDTMINYIYDWFEKNYNGNRLKLYLTENEFTKLRKELYYWYNPGNIFGNLDLIVTTKEYEIKVLQESRGKGFISEKKYKKELKKIRTTTNGTDIKSK